MKKRNYLLFIILPLLLVILSAILIHSRGPAWLGAYQDPDYVYLLNSATFAQTQEVFHTDHPGTPVQMLGALSIKIIHTLSSQAQPDLKTDVVYRSEYYIHILNIEFLLLNALMLLLLGIIAYKVTKSLTAGLLLQLIPFLPGIVPLSSLYRFNPEPLLLFTSVLLVTLLVKTIQNNTQTKSTPFLLTFFFAIVAALGIAIKITFLPLVLLPILIINPIRNKILYFIGLIGGFVLFTFPIISKYGNFIQWVYRLATREGRYGTGKREIISWDSYSQNFLHSLSQNPFFTFLLLFSIVTLLIALFIPSIRNHSIRNPYYKAIFAVVVCQIIGLLIVAKHTGQHYLLPVLTLTGFLLYLLFAFLKQLLQDFQVKSQYILPGFVILLLLIFVFTNPIKQFISLSSSLNSYKIKTSALNQIIAKDYSTYTPIYYYGSSSHAFALKFGNDLAKDQFTQAAEALYPNVYFFDIIRNKFFGFSYNNETTFSQLRDKYEGKVLFVGPKNLSVPGIKLKGVLDSSFPENIFLLDQQDVKIYTQTRDWISQHIPPASTLVIPPESGFSLSDLQKNYTVVLEDMKRINLTTLKFKNALLENPYYFAPSQSFYGKKTLSPKYIQRLKDFKDRIQVEAAFPDESNPRFFIGRLKKEAAQVPPQFKEIPAWNATAPDANTTTPSLMVLDSEGTPTLTYTKENQRNVLSIVIPNSGKKDKRFCLIGYKANKNGFNLDLSRVKQVHMVLSVKIPQHLINAANHIFIQDNINGWEFEKVSFSGTGWMTYYITKQVRDKSDKLLLGIRFTPRSPQDTLQIKDVKIYYNER